MTMMTSRKMNLVSVMADWKCTDHYEFGKEYECPHCKKHVVLMQGCFESFLPEKCPYCGKDVGRP